MKTKVLLMAGSIAGNSVTAKLLDLVDNKGHSLGKAAFSLLEAGVADKQTLDEVVYQIRMHRRER